MFCSKCGQEIAEGDRFCKSCGAEQGVSTYMSSTGQSISEILIPSRILDNLPSMVREGLSKLTASKQEQFIEEYRRKSKNMGITYLLWFILSLHYVYLGRWGLTLLMWITLDGLLIWWIVDAFRIPGMIRNYNKDVAVDVLRTMKAIEG